MKKEPFPSLFHFPTFERFVIFDLETTGLDEKAQPFQFSAIKVDNWRVVDYFNEYANVPLDNIPFSLAQKLHLDEVKDKIHSAREVKKVVDDFLAFIKDLPLVAHNVWFDIEFLRRYKEDLANPFLDSIELFFLAYPLASSYRLEELSNQENIKEEISSLQSELGVEGLFPHNALYDCLALFTLLKKAVERLKRHPSSSLLHLVVPSFAQYLGIPYITIKELTSSLPPPPFIISSQERNEGYTFSKHEVLAFYDKWVRKTGSEERPSQREMVGKVAEIFWKSEIGMIEAPTGTGKTLAYLIPSAFLVRRGGGKVIVATYTKHLQNQAFSDLENKLAGYLQFHPPIKYVLLKGQGNYLCLRSLFGKMEDAFLNFPEQTGDDEKFLIIYLARFVEEVREKIEDLDAIPYLISANFPYLRSLKESIKSNRELCYYKRCPLYERCFFQKARNEAKEADILLTNHWRLLMGKWEEPESYNLVIDEAHNLEDSATDAFSEEVSKESLTTFLTLLLNREGERGLLPKITRIVGNVPEIRGAYAVVRDLWEFTDEMGETLNAFLLKEGKHLHPIYGASLWMRAFPINKRKWRAVINKAEKFLRDCENLEKYINTLKQLPGKNGAYRLFEELDMVVQNLFMKARDLRELLDWKYEKDKRVRWIEVALSREKLEERGLTIENLSPDFLSQPPGELLNWLVKDAPIRVGEILEEKLYKVFRSIVLTSATLTVADRGFGFFLDRLALERYIYDENLVSLPPVFNYRENVLLALPNYLPSDASQQNIERFKRDVLEELAEFICFVEGRTLVLFAARDRLEWVGQNLEPILTNMKLPLYWQRPGASKRQMLQEFKEIEEATLMGVRSFWEGVDVPGSSLCYLILEKLPFPPPEPLVQARREEVRKRGEDEFNNYILPLSLIQFKQGFGRLIRSHSDRGAVIFLDRRLRSDVATREIALQTLPGFTRLEEVELRRLELYKKVADHMKNYYRDEVRIDFPWEEKLKRVKEIEYTPAPIPPEQFSPFHKLNEEGTFLLETQDLSLVVDFFLKQGKKVALISRSDPFLGLDTPFREELVYLSIPPVIGINKLLGDWNKGKVKAVAFHPYWLEFEVLKEILKNADTLIVPNVLSLCYSSTFFDPIIVKNLPETKRKIFLLHPILTEHLNDELSFIKGAQIVEIGEHIPSITLGRTEDFLPFLTSSQKDREKVLIYKPWGGQKLERKLNTLGFLARWGEEAFHLFQKEELHILILPPGRKLEGGRIKLVIHHPPIGDKLSYLMEASQAGFEKEGYSLSCYQGKSAPLGMINFMFPSPEYIEELEKLLRRKKEVLLKADSQTTRALRTIYLLWQEDKADWRLIEKELGITRLGEIKDEKLRKVLEKAMISDKREKRVDLQGVSKENDIPLSQLSSLIRESWQRGEIIYTVKKWGILASRKKLSGPTLPPPVSKEEVLEKWRSLQEWITSLPLIEKVF